MIVPAQKDMRDAAKSARRGVVLVLLIAAVIAVGPHWGTSVAAPAAAPEKLTAPLQIDPNTAGADDLQLLPGIGPKLAAAIIDFREHCEHQPAFARAEDLDQVKRIGPATVERLRPFLVFTTAAQSEENP